MTTATTIPAPSRAVAAWSVELRVGLDAGALAPEERLERLERAVELMARTAGVRFAAVTADGRDGLLRAGITLEAHDPARAVDRAMSLLRAGARYAGLGHVFVQGVRTEAEPALTRC